MFAKRQTLSKETVLRLIAGAAVKNCEYNRTI